MSEPKQTRHARGEAHFNAKFTADDVRAIRAHPRHRGSGVQLARQFNVTTAAISLVRNKKLWRHV